MGKREELLARAEARIINAYNVSFAGMSIAGPVFRYNGREYPINTISAEVVLGAQTSKSRSTATRIIGGGLGRVSQFSGPHAGMDDSTGQ
jgi:hypothetical protein